MRGILPYAIFMYLMAMSASQLMAQDDVSHEYDIREVTVVGKRPLRNTGVEKTSLDTLVLHENIALSMADILQQNSTLFIKSYGRATESTAEFRGTSPSHTQVTWNGMRINSPMIGTVDFSMIPAYLVDEANLYHGSSSITLSGGGLGGAVELNSRPKVEDGMSAKAILGAGSYGTYDAFGNVSYGSGHLEMSTRAVYSTSDNRYPYTNHDKMVDVTDDAGNILYSYHPREKNSSGYFTDVHLMQDVYYRTASGHRIGGSLWYSSTMRGLPFLSVDYKDAADFKNEQDGSNFRGVINWTWMGEKVKTVARTGYAYSSMAYDYYTTRENGTSSNDITHSRSYANTVFGQMQAEYMPSERFMLSADASLYYHHVKSADHSPFHTGDNYNTGRAEYNLCLSARWRPAEPLSLAAVIRQEVYKSDFVPPIPALFAEYVLYEPMGLVVKASVARNYRYPTMDDLYYRPGGNPDLKPEEGFCYDAGLEWKIERKRYVLKGNASFFDSHITNWILWTPNTRGYWQPSNVKKVHNYGIEAMADATYRFSSKCSASLLGNIAWTPSRNMGTPVNANDASYGKQLCYVPVHSAGISARLSYGRWNASYKWTYYSDRYTTTSNEADYITGKLKPYYMSDASIERTFDTRFSAFSLKLQVNNLLSSEYVTVLSHPMPGRNFEIFLDIRPKFSKKRG